MSVPLERACLLVADISGYTGYLADVELDHAQDILADLLSTVVKALRPGFRLSRLEGDAAFVYAPTETVDGSLLLDTIESCYFAFRRRLLSIRQSSTCECRACSLMPVLDLKMLVHHGTIARTRIAGREELVGSDAVVVHRMAKNRVRDELELTAYAFLTDACVASTALDAEALGMRRHAETYDVGEVAGWVHDLERAWKLDHERRRVYVDDADALWSAEMLVPAPAALVWEYATSPRLRPLWQVGVTEVREQSSGRRGVGTTNHCVHGEDASIEEVLDWRPPRYVTKIGTIPGLVSFVSTDEVVEVEGGVAVRTRIKARKAKDRAAVQQVIPMYQSMVIPSLERLREVVVEAYASVSAHPEAQLPTTDPARRTASALRSG